MSRGHGEGSKKKRSDGRWEWSITMPDGRRRSFYGKTEKEARKKKNDAVRDYEAGLRAAGERLTVATYLTAWLTDTAPMRVRHTTLTGYRSLIEQHIIPVIGTVRLRDLGPMDVSRMMMAGKRKALSPTTINQVRAVLRIALNEAMRSGLVLRNAAQLSQPHRVERARVDPFTVEQARTLLDTTRTHWMGPLVAVALATGMRQGELLALRWSDIDEGIGILRVERTLTWKDKVPVFDAPKTPQSRRSIRLTAGASDALVRQRQVIRVLQGEAQDWQHSNLVFPSKRGTPQDGTNVTHRFQSMLKQAGLPRKRFHDLRHTTASFLLSEGVDLFVVKEILGHAGIGMTADIYGHMTRTMADDAAERLDRALQTLALDTPTVGVIGGVERDSPDHTSDHRLTALGRDAK